jgi:hypothetical protein
MDGVCRCDTCLPALSPCGNYDAHNDTTDVFYPIPLDVNHIDNIDTNDHQLFQSLR